MSVLRIPRLAATALVAFLGFVLARGSAGADSLVRPRREPEASPASARSVQILRKDEPLFDAPRPTANRRGAAALGALLPLRGSRRGSGCGDAWLSVGDGAWVCSDFVRRRSEPAPTPRRDPEPHGNGLPFDYYFVGTEGSFGYLDLSLAEEVAPDAELQPGFAVAVVQLASRASGDPFGFTSKRLWLPMRDLSPAAPSSFRGAVVADGQLAGGWVVADVATVHEVPGGRAHPEGALGRQTRVRIFETVERTGTEWSRIGEGRWVKRRDLGIETRSSLPPGLRPNERWIDIDLANQVLAAYEGSVPIFSTLVSSGRGKGDDPQATPKGLFRIWVKLRTSDMTNLENEEANRYYAMEEVPWVMFFHKGYGLHGAFWHRSFGRVRSHGCVNLAPIDAQRLFYFAEPRLPQGWTAVLPTDGDTGTLVRVR